MGFLSATTGRRPVTVGGLCDWTCNESFMRCGSRAKWLRRESEVKEGQGGGNRQRVKYFTKREDRKSARFITAACILVVWSLKALMNVLSRVYIRMHNFSRLYDIWSAFSVYVYLQCTAY